MLGITATVILMQTQGYSAATLQPSSNGRYIQWSDGTPVFLLSDTCWLLPGRYSTSEITAHVNTRKSQGFTALQMSACFPEVQGGTALQNINAIFTGGDLARPVASYWNMVDAKVKQCTDAGMIVILNPFWKKTYDSWLDANGPTKCRAYGKWFATRYRNNPRVAYFVGGDDRPEPIRDEMNNMGLGIQDAYAAAGLPKPIVAYHGDPGQTSREAFPTETWVTLNWSYNYAPPFSGAEGTGGSPYVDNWQDWVKTPAKPIQFGEGFYDRNNGGAASSRWGDRFMLRRQAWWSTVGGGIGGYAYGAEPIWLHGYGGFSVAQAAGWESGKDAARMKSFLTGNMQWWKLQPDINHKFLTGGYGTFKRLDYALAAVANDNSFAVVYSPTAHTLNLRMPASGLTYTLRWFDPSSGAFRSGSTTAASGAAVNMTTPGNNASGKPDWVIFATTSGGGGGGGGGVTPGNGTFKITSLISGKALDAFSGHTTNGTPIIQWTYGGGNNQRWTLQDRGASQFSIIGVASGKALDVTGNGIANGTKVQLWTYTGVANQKWTFSATSGGFYRVTPVHATGSCLDVTGASTANGAPIQIWTYKGDSNQQWSFTAP
ncbi:MAG: DUF4038 domain-containing protein [Akkermansiaceae bacterium]|nr:DUF4038 domain-containing protein [Verrucomicrobiales bacterium]